MKKKYNIIPAFSKVLYQSQLDYSENDLVDMVNFIEKSDYKSSIGYYVEKHKENQNNYYKSSVDKFILNTHFFKELKKKIVEEFNFFKNDILFYNNNDFKITTSWVSKTEKNQSSFFHNHHNCMYSGIFYLRTTNNTGNLIIEDHNDVRFKLEPTLYNFYNAREFTFDVQNNSIIFFPSECHHRVLTHNSDITRYAIAFNLIPVGKIGIEGDDSFVNLQTI